MSTLEETKQKIRDLPDDEFDANQLFDLIKSERKRRSKRAVQRFSKGDKVAYVRSGASYEGVVYKVSRTNVGVEFDHNIKTGEKEPIGARYKIPASELELVEGGT